MDHQHKPRRETRAKRLVLQAGFPKCGSTSIFAALRQSLRKLEKHDIYVLNNQFALHRTRRTPVAPRMELEDALALPEAAERMRSALIAAIHDCPEGGTIVICTEMLADPEKGRLFTGLDHLCDVELVFYFRPQAQWIASAWKQWELKTGQSLPMVVQSCMANRYPDYLGTARGWEAAVPGIRVTPRPLLHDFMVNGHPSYDFLKLIGVDVRRDPALEERKNSSMDYSLLYLLQRNSARIFKSRHDNAPYRQLMAKLPEAYRRTNIAMFDQQQSDLIADHFHADGAGGFHVAGGPPQQPIRQQPRERRCAGNRAQARRSQRPCPARVAASGPTLGLAGAADHAAAGHAERDFARP